MTPHQARARELLVNRGPCEPRQPVALASGCRTRALLVLAALLSVLGCGGASAGVTVLGVQYQQDKYFPEDYCLWHDRQYPGPCSINLNTGQVVKVFLKNTGSSSVSVSDVTLATLSLSQNIKQVTFLGIDDFLHLSQLRGGLHFRKGRRKVELWKTMLLRNRGEQVFQ